MTSTHKHTADLFTPEEVVTTIQELNEGKLDNKKVASTLAFLLEKVQGIEGHLGLPSNGKAIVTKTKGNLVPVLSEELLPPLTQDEYIKRDIELRNGSIPYITDIIRKNESSRIQELAWNVFLRKLTISGEIKLSPNQKYFVYTSMNKQEVDFEIDGVFRVLPKKSTKDVVRIKIASDCIRVCHGLHEIATCLEKMQKLTSFEDSPTPCYFDDGRIIFKAKNTGGLIPFKASKKVKMQANNTNMNYYDKETLIDYLNNRRVHIAEKKNEVSGETNLTD